MCEVVNEELSIVFKAAKLTKKNAFSLNLVTFLISGRKCIKFILL